MKILVNWLVFCWVVLFSMPSFSTEIQPLIIDVPFRLLGDYGVTINTESGSPLCGEASDMVIEFPSHYKGDVYKHLNLSILSEGDIILDVPLAAYPLEGKGGGGSSYEVSLCVRKEIIKNVKLSIAYGNRKFLTKILVLHGLKQPSDAATFPELK